MSMTRLIEDRIANWAPMTDDSVTRDLLCEAESELRRLRRLLVKARPAVAAVAYGSDNGFGEVRNEIDAAVNWREP